MTLRLLGYEDWQLLKINLYELFEAQLSLLPAQEQIELYLKVAACHRILNSITNPQLPPLEREPLKQGFSNLRPNTLVTFANSIGENDWCLALWQHYFNIYDTTSMINYFKDITDKLRLEADREFTKTIILRLHYFSERIQNQFAHTGQNMMWQVAICAANQEAYPHPRSHSEALLSLLNSVLYHSEYNEEDYLAALIVFKRNIIQMIHTTEPNNALAWLSRVLNNISAEITSDNARIVNVITYLQRLQQRLQQPLPDNLLFQFSALTQCYRESKANTSQRFKLQLLESVLKIITTHPEKTYAACIRQAKQELPNNPESHPKPSGVLRFFSRHRTQQFLRQLHALDAKNSCNGPLS
jgi:hypothetical protein